MVYRYPVRLGKCIAAVGLGLGLLVSGNLRADPPAPYQVGEQLTYTFYWGLFLVGRGTFEVARNPAGNLLLTVQGKSNDFVSAIYPVDDRMTSEFDPEHTRSIRFLQDRREGRHRCWEETFFFHTMRQAAMQSYVTGENKWFDLPKGAVQDKLSIIYFMRGKDWGKKGEHGATIGNDKGNFEIRVKKIASQNLELDDFAPIPTFQVEPSVNYLSGFLKKAKVRAWVSDDHFKVPVRITIEAAFGTLTADLIKVRGIEGWPYERK